MIEKARIDEVQEVLRLVNHYAERQLMLPRSLNEIYEGLRDFYVWREDGRMRGCVALHISWQGLGEIRSLAVAESDQGRGIGSALVEACLAEARELAIERVFVLTYLPAFFERFGFRPYPKENLPHKIWTDCLNCPKFPDCDEVALMLELGDWQPNAR